MIKTSENNSLNHKLLSNIEGNKILDYMLRTRIDEKHIPQLFNGKIIFISYSSFQQNNYILSKYIRRYVLQNIKTDEINAIGGESYLYMKKCRLYTNSESIIDDAGYNCYKDNKLIDYNSDTIDLLSSDTVINLSKLNVNLIKQINESSSNRLIIINCHHDDFWKKSKKLTNYKLIKRKKFIDDKRGYFITVNIFIRKSFVSLGSSCAVTYQLNKLKLRNVSYPFDWMNIKITKLIEVFKSKFKDYTEFNTPKYLENHNSYTVKNSYGYFAHEIFKENEVSHFIERLNVRIPRLYSIKNPIFVRLETYKFKNKVTYRKYWIELCSLLNEVYDGNYKIILISQINPELNKIKWYEYESFNEDWRNDELDWSKYLY